MGDSVLNGLCCNYAVVNSVRGGRVETLKEIVETGKFDEYENFFVFVGGNNIDFDKKVQEAPESVLEKLEILQETLLRVQISVQN